MKLKLELNGIIFTLDVFEEDIDDKHYSAMFSLESEKWLDYTSGAEGHIEYSEIEDLKNNLRLILLDELKEYEEFDFCNLNLSLSLFPKRIDCQLSLFDEGVRITDINGELKVNFNNKSSSSNYLSMFLDKKDIEYLKNYFNLITNEMNLDTPVIQKMLDNGILLG